MTLRLRVVQAFTWAFMFTFTVLAAEDLFVDPAGNAAPSPSLQFLPRTAVPEATQAATDSEKLQEVIENHLAALRTFDISRAYYAYTTRDFQKNVSLEAFKQFVKKFSVLFRNKHVTQDEVSFAGNVATYKGKLVSNDGEVYAVEIVLVSVEDEWKIHSLSLVPQANPRRALR